MHGNTHHILPDHTVTDTIGDLLRASHWQRIATLVARHRRSGSDSGVVATVARGIQQKEAA